MYLATAQEMNAWDAATIKMGMPAFSLMENASREVWHVLCNLLATNGQSLQGKSVLLFAGGGNNGGDAIALARLLHNEIPHTALNKVKVTLEENTNLHPSACPVLDVLNVLVVHTKPLQNYEGMAQEHLKLAMACGVRFMSAEEWLEATQYGGGPFVDLVTKRQSTPHIIIDGLLGTGFHGPLRGTTLAVIERLNTWLHDCFQWDSNHISSALFSPLHDNTTSKMMPQPYIIAPYIIAIDCPSGLDSTTGAPSPMAIPAHTTVTFEAPKIGLVTQAARPYVGNVLVRPIGIPSRIQSQHPTECTLLHHNIMRHLPSMEKLGHKGDAGHVLVIGGSQGLTGAAHLSAKAALRSGAGLVSMAVPRGLEVQAQCSVPDIMVMGVGCVDNQKTDNHAAPTIYNDAKWPSTNLQEALHHTLKLAASCRALVLGPGIGRSPEAAAVVHAVLSMPKPPPLVIDADALFALAHYSVLPPSYWHSLMICTNAADDSKSRQAPNPLLSLVQSHDILTPHPTEAARIVGWTTTQVQADRMTALKTLMSMVTGTVVLKGACTLIGQAPKLPLAQPSITVSPFMEPHLSVAGSGDVLAGLIASLIAQGISPTIAAPLGVLLHAKAGALLAQQFPKRGNTASDLISMLPQSLIP